MKGLLVATLVVLGAHAGCNESGVGQSCGHQYRDGGVSAFTIISPAPECATRLCYVNDHTGTTDRRTCTALCDTDDDCKPYRTGDPQLGLCGSSFVCAVGLNVGPWACRKICVCRDDLMTHFNVESNGQIICPSLCSAPHGQGCVGRTQ